MTDPLVRMYLDEIKGAVAARRHFDAELNVVAAEIKRLYGDNLTTKIDTKDVAFLITKANDDADWFNFSGVASTDAVNSGDDIIAAGAFGSIDPSHVAMLFMHSPETPIGKWLEVTQEGRQLHCKGAILKSLTKGQEAATMISKGVITGLSVGFKIKAAIFDKAAGVRRITSAILHEISICALPSNRAARISAAQKSLQTPRKKSALW